MQLVFLTALGVGGATVSGVVIGFLFRELSQRYSDIVLSFAAGVMLTAAIEGLIQPALACEGRFVLPVSVLGIFAGAACLSLGDRWIPHLRPLAGRREGENTSRDGVLLFVAAIAVHNLPEGIAAGVGFGTGEVSDALMIAGGIALQNIPEGMVIVSPMLASGISARRTFLIAVLTGVIEVVGTLIGYFAVRFASAILPAALGFAGGTMLYVIGDEMIPRTHSGDCGRGSTFALLVGFCLMLVINYLL